MTRKQYKEEFRKQIKLRK